MARKQVSTLDYQYRHAVSILVIGHENAPGARGVEGVEGVQGPGYNFQSNRIERGLNPGPLRVLSIVTVTKVSTTAR